MADGDIPGKFVQIGLKVPPEFADRLDVFLAGRNRSQFIRDMLEGAMSGGLVTPEPKVVSAEPGQVIALPRAKPSGRGVDADRVIACLRERKRSARDVANALKMDFATAGEVMGALIRDGVVRKRADKVLELVG